LKKENSFYSKLIAFSEQSVSIAPLVFFRIAFGLLMLFSTLRYVWLGWVDTQLVEPIFHFSYFGFDWVKPLPRLGMYSVFAFMAISAIGITLGWYYRISSVILFMCFTYVELIDITYYLNHYYFVSIVSFLLILVPAHLNFSIDVKRNRILPRSTVSRWCILIFQVQIAIVYCYAGLAKINSDWLLNALPLSIWLPAKSSVPIIGKIFDYEITAYLFSWAGMLFDTLIILGLIFKRTRLPAYLAVVIFHTLTGILFQIGVFPVVMIFGVTIFFSASFHEKVLKSLDKIVGFNLYTQKRENTSFKSSPILFPFLIVFFLFQLLFPWRYVLYPGNVFWTEEGYRFAWRVMLMEKAGTATFFVKDGENGKEGAVINHQFLNNHQEKQMAMQPDLILQYAHLLEDHFRDQGLSDPHIRAEVWVTLNARPAALLIDPHIDLTNIKDGWRTKEWILPYPYGNK
jgi:hypothetical protein